METKPQQANGLKKDLAPLPDSSDDFWQYSEKFPVENIEINKDCQHYFLLVRASEAQCKNCLWGFNLSLGDRIENGHLYCQKGLVI